MEAVGELDEDDADVLRHRDDHLAVVLGLGLLAALEADPRQLRDALDEDARSRLPNSARTLLEVGVRVLDDVVQERRGDRLLVEVELGADPRDAERVVDELLARAARLAGVRALGDLERAAEQLLVDVRVVRLDLGDQLLDQVFAMPFRVEDTHEFSVLSGFRPLAGRIERAATREIATIHAQSPTLVAQPQRTTPRARDARRARSVAPRPRLTQAAARQRGVDEQRPERLRLEQLTPCGAPSSASSSSAKMRRASGVQALSPARQSSASVARSSS